MKNNRNKKVCYLTFKIFEDIEFMEHGFSTRLGGYSEGPYNSMNLRRGSQDTIRNVEKNFNAFLDVFNCQESNCFMTNQVHDNKIINIIDNSQSHTLDETDGLITALSDVGLMTFHADCVPVFFVDVRKKVVGLVHSGWRGTLKGISRKMIETFQNKYNTKIDDLRIGIGPSIDQCCYEVGEEVYQAFINENLSYISFFKENPNNKYMMDLKGIIRFDLINQGISKNNIEQSKACTSCNDELFYSHRRQGSIRGGMAAFIKIKKESTY